MLRLMMLLALLSALLPLSGCRPMAPSGGRAPQLMQETAKLGLNLSFTHLALLERHDGPFRLTVAVYKLQGEELGARDGNDRSFDIQGTGQASFELEELGLGRREFQLKLVNAAGVVVAEARFRHTVKPGLQTVAEPVRLILQDPANRQALDVVFKVWFKQTTDPSVVVYDDVKEIWITQCASCHKGPYLDYRSFPFFHDRFETQEGIVKEALRRIKLKNYPMPPPQYPPLSPEDIAKIEAWLAGGLQVSRAQALASPSSSPSIPLQELEVALNWHGLRTGEVGHERQRLDEQGDLRFKVNGVAIGEPLQLNYGVFADGGVELGSGRREALVPEQGELSFGVELPAPEPGQVTVDVIVE